LSSRTNVCASLVAASDMDGRSAPKYTARLARCLLLVYLGLGFL
jgi:hypothetical protein